MRNTLVMACLVISAACTQETDAPIAQLHQFETIALVTSGDIVEITETGRWLHVQLSPSSDREVARLRQLDEESELTLLVAGHAAGPVRVRELLQNDELRLTPRDWAGAGLAPPLNRLRAVTASESRVLIRIGVATPIAHFSQANILDASPDEGRARFQLDGALEQSEDLLLTAGGFVLASGFSVAVDGDQVHASGIRRDILERWAETEQPYSAAAR